MTQKIIKRSSKNNLDGNIVQVGEQSFESAFRRFKKKIETSGLLRELKERETYTKPTTIRKQKHAAAVKRWQREQQKNKLPPKFY